jgi:hypothetical protein
MQNARLIGTTIAAAVLAVSLAACSQEMASPERQTTTGEQPRMEETTVSGCLKTGMDEHTFVLMAPQTAGAETSTYQLTSGSDVNLREHVNQQVQVTGTLRAEQEFASVGKAVEEDRAKGTSGTPVVETKTEVQVKRLAVSAVRPTGEKCAE